MNKIKVLQLNNHVKPEIKEVYGQDWVLNGKDNGYFKYVIDRYNGSPTNAAIINSFIERIYGKGITALDASRKPDEYAKLISLLPKRELKKIVADFELQTNAAIQVVYAKDGKPVKCYHIPVETLAPEKVNEEGDIEAYYYCQDWSQPHKYKPERIDAFGYGSGKKKILYIRPYKAGQYYFATPDYQAALQYAELEEEISNFSVNHIKNGLSLGQVINFNNGVPAEEVQEEIERDINAKLKGTNGRKWIVAFNDNKDNATTVDNIQKDDASSEWHFWVDEARQQIITGHRVVSPMLFGIKDNTGLGNNADEMETANRLMEETVIRPKQEMLLDAIDEVLSEAGISLDLAFKPLKEMEQEVSVQPTELKMSCNHEMADALIDLGEDEDLENWELISTEEVDYEKEEERDQLLLRISPKVKPKASTGTARPNAKSEQDSENFKVRYQYAPLATSENSRDFCKKMVRANKIYRKEDIIQMGNKAVNPGWGLNGADTYSIWLYKGGGDCHHKWLRKTYVKKGADVDVNSPNAETISTAEARRRGDRTRNPKEVSIKPTDMPNNGFVNR